MDLKPCPFCGEVPELNFDKRYQCDYLLHRCSVIGVIKLEMLDTDTLISLWNTRTPEPVTDVQQQANVIKPVASIREFIDWRKKVGKPVDTKVLSQYVQWINTQQT